MQPSRPQGKNASGMQAALATMRSPLRRRVKVGNEQVDTSALMSPMRPPMSPQDAMKSAAVVGTTEVVGSVSESSYHRIVHNSAATTSPCNEIDEIEGVTQVESDGEDGVAGHVSTSPRKALPRQQVSAVRSPRPESSPGNGITTATVTGEVLESEDLTLQWVQKGRTHMLRSLGVEEVDGPMAAAEFIRSAAGQKYRDRLKKAAGQPAGVVFIAPRTLAAVPKRWAGHSSSPRDKKGGSVAERPVVSASGVLQLERDTFPHDNSFSRQDSAQRSVEEVFSCKRYSADTNFIPFDQLVAWEKMLESPPHRRSNEQLKSLDDGCLSRVPSFADTSLDMRQFLLRYATYVNVEPGGVVYRQNEPADAVYVILAGFVQVIIDMSATNVNDLDLRDLENHTTISEQGVINVLGPLNSFGERGLSILFKEMMQEWDGRELQPTMNAVKAKDPSPPRAFFPENEEISSRVAVGDCAGGGGTAATPSGALEQSLRYKRLLQALKRTVQDSDINPSGGIEGYRLSSKPDSMGNREPLDCAEPRSKSVMFVPVSPRILHTKSLLHNLMAPADDTAPLVVSGGRRVATVKAATDTAVHLLRIPAIPYLYLLARNRREVQDIATVVMKQTDVFGTWPEHLLNRVALSAKKVQYRPGDVVAAQGQPADGVFILLLGHCRVLRTLTLDDKAYTQVMANLRKTHQHVGQAGVSPHPVLEPAADGSNGSKSSPEIRPMTQDSDIARRMESINSARKSKIDQMVSLSGCISTELPVAHLRAEDAVDATRIVAASTASCSPSKNRINVDVMRLRKLDTFGFQDVILGSDIQNKCESNTADAAVGPAARESAYDNQAAALQHPEDELLMRLKPQRRRSSLSAVLDAIKNAEQLGLRATTSQGGGETVQLDANTRAAISSMHVYSQTLVAETRVEMVFIPRVPSLLDACLADPAIAQHSWDAAIDKVPSDESVLHQLIETVEWSKYKTALKDNVLRDFAWQLEKDPSRAAVATMPGKDGQLSHRSPIATRDAHRTSSTVVNIATLPRNVRLNNFRFDRFDDTELPDSVFADADNADLFDSYATSVLSASFQRRKEKMLATSDQSTQDFRDAVKAKASAVTQSIRKHNVRFSLLPSAPDVVLAKMKSYVSPDALGLKLSDRSRRRSSVVEQQLHGLPEPAMRDTSYSLMPEPSAATLATISSQEMIHHLLMSSMPRKIVLSPLPLSDSESEDEKPHLMFEEVASSGAGRDTTSVNVISTYTSPLTSHSASGRVASAFGITPPSGNVHLSSRAAGKSTPGARKGAPKMTRLKLKSSRGGSAASVQRLHELADRLHVPDTPSTTISDRGPSERSALAHYAKLSLGSVLKAETGRISEEDKSAERLVRAPRNVSALSGTPGGYRSKRRGVVPRRTGFHSAVSSGGVQQSHSSSAKVPNEALRTAAELDRQLSAIAALATAQRRNFIADAHLEHFALPRTLLQNTESASVMPISSAHPLSSTFHRLKLSALDIQQSRPTGMAQSVGGENRHGLSPLTATKAV